MAIANIRSLALAMLMVATTLICGNHQVSAQCGTSVQALVAQCYDFVVKTGPQVPPSAGCCTAVRGVNIPCICKLITKEIENIISMKKVVYVAQTCGLTVPHRLQCGSYTVPKA